ncbi:MAG: phosphoglycerate dehydrogenase [Anaeroplasmataceae bacterium]
MVKINCLNAISKVGLDVLTSNYEIVDKFEEADAVLVRSQDMKEMEMPKNLMAIARAGAGVNNIPLDKCALEGIVVFNTPGANANAVKELVLAGMLLASRDIIGGINWCKENATDSNIAKSQEKAKKAFAGNEILGKKLGVIGLGAIGVLVANAAASLGMEVYGCDPYLSVQHALNLSSQVHVVKTNEEIYKNCDFITIHVPLLDSTKGLINAEAISMMKPNVTILNFARDLLVDEECLVKALEEGKVKSYVTDFANPVTAGKKGVILTPHLGASTEEAEDNCAKMAALEIMDYMENGNITNSVNYPQCDAGKCQSAARVTICHKNVANMIAQFTTVFGELNINITNMVNKSRGDYAYTVIDVDNEDLTVVSKLQAIENVYKVRLIK